MDTDTLYLTISNIIAKLSQAKNKMNSMEDDLNWGRPQYILISDMTRFECLILLDSSV